MRPSETLHHPKPEPDDDTTKVVDNFGYVHLANAAEEEDDLYYRSGEDSDGDPNHAANPNSRAYNRELDPTDEPLLNGTGRVEPPDLDQVADLPPDSEKPASER
jgi:hypothetical protein